MRLTLTFTLKSTTRTQRQTWLYFSNSQFPFHQQKYSSITSIRGLHFTTHTLF